jgi:hypothetical protein
MRAGMSQRELFRENSVGRRGALLLCALILSAIAAGCSDSNDVVKPAGQDTLTVAFQDLVSPSMIYAGTSDAILKDGPATQFRNGNFGAVAYDTIGVVCLGSYDYERRLILRMDISSIKSCSKVIRATLKIHTNTANWRELVAFSVPPDAVDSWIEGIGGLGAGVSWTTVDGGVPWAKAGGDCSPAALDTSSVEYDSTGTFALPPALVLGWIKNPASNHGMIVRSLYAPSIARSADGRLEPASVPAFATVFTREYSEARLHPRLEIVYLPG